MAASHNKLREMLGHSKTDDKVAVAMVKGSRMDLKILSVAALIRVFIALITKDNLQS
jgi:hypothetical protein